MMDISDDLICFMFSFTSMIGTSLFISVLSMADGGPWRRAKILPFWPLYGAFIAAYGRKARNIGRYLPYRRGQNLPPPPWPIFDNTDLYQQSSKDAVSLFIFQSKRKRPRTPTPGHYLGLKNTRDYGKFETLL